LTSHAIAVIGRLLFFASIASLCMSCASTPDPGRTATTVAPPPQPSYQEWEQATRDRADDAMAEVQRLAAEGNIAEAMAHADDALCLVFDIPRGYPIRQVYLDYLAEIIDALAEIDALRRSHEEVFTPAEDMIVLPPIDIIVDTSVVEGLVDEGGLPHSDFPLVLNPEVEKSLAAMTSEGEYHRRVGLGLSRAGVYLPMIRSVFEAAGLPVDLSYLPLIESAFSVKAYSRARAHGMWQFISATGRHYGLEVGTLVDERRDPVRATEAAAAYLSDLYGEFNDWYLALAAYNSGAGNVRRAIRKSGSQDFWALRGYLPRETRNYVPAFIASVIVAKDPEAFGFTSPQEQPWNYDSVEVPDALDLQFMASKSGIPLDELRELNPAIRRDLTPAQTTTQLRIPHGKAETALAVLESNPRSDWAPRMIHSVRSGESLYTIAHRYGSNVSAIKQANGLRSNLIHPGENLIVPRFGTEPTIAAKQDFSAGADGRYVVERNDTLWDIARGFSVSVDSLCAANNLSRNSVIRPGQKLRIPDGTKVTHPSGKLKTHSTAAPGSTYVVRPGDTLFDIARKFGVSTSALQRANKLRGSRIYPGDVLTIPVSNAHG
jgi:membrane-bound lytic murein transglycosylase D